MGQININIGHMETTPKKYNDFTMTVLHEVLHVLGFSPNLYEHFTDEKGYNRGLSRGVKEFKDKNYNTI